MVKMGGERSQRQSKLQGKHSIDGNRIIMIIDDELDVIVKERFSSLINSTQ